ncbi:hypothetical protein MMC19_006440 [Ptychographa xylographoides]|nr:hypothetical protein [Ptychographa xylographoides]
MPDFKPYEKPMWQSPAPTAQGQALWQEPTDQFGKIPEPLYRLRISILHNKQGHHDTPERIFVFPNQKCLSAASAKLSDVFGGAFSTYSIEKRPIGARGELTGDGEMENVEDGRTENVLMGFDSQTADESWKEFVGRLRAMEAGWTRDQGNL